MEHIILPEDGDGAATRCASSLLGASRELVGVQMASCQIWAVLFLAPKYCSETFSPIWMLSLAWKRFECSCYVGKMFTDLVQKDPFIMDFGAQNWTSF